MKRKRKFSVSSRAFVQYKNVLGRIVELCLVPVAAVCLIIILNNMFIGRTAWLNLPFVLVAAALLPTIIRGEKIGVIGLNLNHLGYSLQLLAIASLTAFPITWGGLWLLKYIGIGFPLMPTSGKGPWGNWILYQFMYVATAEEIFFRGYVLGSLLKCNTPILLRYPRLWQGISVLISAAVFALAHVILLGNILPVLTFLPGLLLGWLFLRTGSLLAPVLFHALANIFYAIITTALA